jgi:hypothetical protein
VFVTNQLGGMYCVDAKSGMQTWWAPEVTRFIAASKDRVYATDKIGLLHVLSAKTGSHLDTIPAEYLAVKLTNPESDRLFLASATGMIQCLHEPGIVEPLVRRVPHKEIEVPDRTKLAGKTATQEKPSDEGAPGPTKTAGTRPSGGGGGSSGAPRASTPKAKKGDFAGAAGGKKSKKPKGGQEAAVMPGMPGAMPGVVPGGAGGKKKKKQ